MIVKVENGKVSIEVTGQTPNNQKAKILELVDLVGSWYGACEIFGLTVNENGVRLLKKWSAGDDKPKLYVQMPKSQWRLLNIVLENKDRVLVTTE